MPSKVIILDDGFKVLDIDCECGIHSQVTHEDVFTHTCFCGRLYFNLAYYYFDKDYVAHRNDDYWKEKAKKTREINNKNS